jgi:hypothetical protein
MCYNCSVVWGRDTVQARPSRGPPPCSPKIPAKISVPPGLPLNKRRSLPTRSESTLPQPLIPLHFISFGCNVYKKPGEGPVRLSPKVLQLVTSPSPLRRARTNVRNPIPLMHFLHNSRTPRGWGGGLSVGQPNSSPSRGFRAMNPGCLFSQRAEEHDARSAGHWSRVPEHGPRLHWSPGTVAPQPAKCQNHASCLYFREQRRQETYPLLAVSNVLRADIGYGKSQRRPDSKSIPERRTGIALARRPGSTVQRWDLTAGWSG